MPGWAVEGPDGVAGHPTRPPVVTAGVDAAGNIRRVLTDTTGAQHIVIDSGSVTTGGLTDTQLRASAVPVSLSALPALAAGTAVIGHVIVDSGAVTATLAAETTKVIGTVNVAGSQTIAVTNAGTFAAQATLAAETTKVVGTVNQSTGQGRTLLFGTIAQGAAGTTSMVAANGSNKVKLVSYVIVMDAAGTYKFSDGVADLSGAFPVAANGGASAIGQPSSHLLETGAVNRALSIVTTTGKAFGHFSYFLEA